ncbi:MAG TPA: hypothetical protein VFS08_07550 [Gemmatimonadaceae bacterium]|nr:hypothetical protein [Gemmatimonadaceae bacterium]
MPTYKPDGTIQLDTENTIGSGGVGPHGVAGGTPTAYSDEWFRDDLQTIEGLQADRGYEHYEPAFRHGWEAAGRYRGRGWSDVERDVEREWRDRHTDRDWQQYHGAIRHAFERAMRVFEGAK